MSVYAGPNSLQSGLVLHLDSANPRSYPGSGTTWFDLSGNNNNGTLTGSPTFNTGADKGFVFNGTNGNNITIQDSSSLMVSTGISISCWVRFNISLGSMSDFVTLVSKENYGTNSGYYLALRTDQANDPLTFRLNGSLTISNINWVPGTLFNDFKWHFIVVTYNKVSMSLFVDGILRASYAYTSNITSNSTNLVVGNRFNGLMDCIRIYGTAIPKHEMDKLFQSQRGRYGI